MPRLKAVKERRQWPRKGSGCMSQNMGNRRALCEDKTHQRMGCRVGVRRLWLGASIKRKLTCVKLSVERRDYRARLVPSISGLWLSGGAAGRAT